MPRFVDTQSNFSGGQVDPAVQARSDLELYKKSSKELSNCAVRITGGIDKRPGHEFINEFANSGIGTFNDHRLIPFLFNDSQRYAVILGASSLAVQTVDGTTCTITTGGGAAPTWTEAEMLELTWTHVADTMILFHKDHQPRTLIRTGATAFTLNLFGFTSKQTGEINCPMLPKRSDLGVYVKTSSHYGNGVTVTTLPTAQWTLDDVGKQISVEGVTGLIQSVNTLSGSKYLNAVVNFHDKMDLFIKLTQDPGYAFGPLEEINRIGDVLHDYSNGSSGGVGPTGTKQAPEMSVKRVNNGASTMICRAINEHVPAALDYMWNLTSHRDFRVLTAAIDTAELRDWWEEEAYNDEYGWPACGTFHEGRLWIAGGDNCPYHVFGSKVGNWFDFNTEDGGPADAIAVTAASNNLANILHLHSTDDLQAYTDAGMLKAPSTDDTPLAPDNTRFKQQTNYGCSNIKPYDFDGATFFVQENNKTIRENIFDASNREKHSSLAISLTAEEMIKDVKSATVLTGINERNEQYALFLNTDNTLAVYQSNREEGARSWAPWSYSLNQGIFQILDIQAIGNEAFVLVRTVRIAGSVDNRYYFAKVAFDQTMDMAVELTHVSGEVWNMPAVIRDYYALGKQAVITMGDASGNKKHAYYLGEYTIDYTTGNVTIPGIDAAYASYTVWAGIHTDSVIKPLPISKVYTDGDVLVDVKRVSAITVDSLNTAQLRVDNQDMSPLSSYADLGVEPISFTGLTKYYLMGWDYAQDIEIRNTLPLPFHIRSLIREVEI